MDTNSNTEAELETFRQRWRQEVSSRAKTQAQPSTCTSEPSQSGPGRPPLKSTPSAAGPPSRPTGPISHPEQNDAISHSYHDLPDNEEHLKLGNQEQRSKVEQAKEPRTALEHYEKASEREGQGQLGDSLMLYRKAFKLDEKVHEIYKNKHHPPVAASSKTTQTQQGVPSATSNKEETRIATIAELLDEFSQLSIPPAEPETDLSDPPPCPLAAIPGEILHEIFMTIAIRDVATYGRLAQVCKRFAYLIMTDTRIWKRIALGPEFGFAAMHYRYAVDIRGTPLHILNSALPLSPPTPVDLTPSAAYPTHRDQFRHRPRLRFNGCYISTVNYTRPGASDTSRFTWIAPVQIVTYYRYLRFFRDGTAISLLTTAEPANVVHHLTKENLHMHFAQGSNLPNAVMKDALAGRWRLSGELPPSYPLPANDNTFGPGTYAHEPPTLDATTGLPSPDAAEVEGDVHIETEGVLPKYMWKMQLSFGSAGRKEGTRNGKLSWKGFWSYNRLTDDWGEFGLRNDRPFYWSRVRSFR